MDPSSGESSSFSEWQKEREYLEQEKLAHPGLFLRLVNRDSDDILERVGIGRVFGERPRGHIKLHPEDFIVEEITKDGMLHSIVGENTPVSSGEPAPELRTVWADVVKMGIDTIEVANEISKRLGIEKKFIGTAGIKDKNALTAQSISMRDVPADALTKFDTPNFFFKNIRRGKGALQTGDLAQNRFTIAVRTAAPIRQNEIEEKLRDLEEQGFWNFFYLQRFGTPRLISHTLGLLILKGEYEAALKALATLETPGEIPFFRQFRETLLPLWGDWNRFLNATEHMPYSFRNERRAARFLLEHPGDFAGALNQIPDQVKLWVYAYGSFVFNTTLSTFIANDTDIPFSLPLPLGGDPAAQELYAPFFEAHGVIPPFATLRPFPYIQKMEKDVEVLKRFTLNGVRSLNDAVIIDFSLEKGSYATTFLSHLFVLSSGQPVPRTITTRELDLKAELGLGSIQKLKDGKFKTLFAMRQEPEIAEENI